MANFFHNEGMEVTKDMTAKHFPNVTNEAQAKALAEKAGNKGKVIFTEDSKLCMAYYHKDVKI
jgi:hypothetical protein